MRWLFMVLLFVGWVIRNHKLLPPLRKIDEIYFTTRLRQNNGRQNGLKYGMLFSDISKIVMKKVTFVGFREDNRPNRFPWIQPWFKCYRNAGNQNQDYIAQLRNHCHWRNKSESVQSSWAFFYYRKLKNFATSLNKICLKSMVTVLYGLNTHAHKRSDV